MKSQPQIITRIIDAIRDHQTFCVVGHLRPDGDCVGSQLGLALALRNEGKKVVCWNEDAMPQKLKFLDPDGLFQKPKPGQKFDCVIATDCASFERLGKVGPCIADRKLLINIDHHESNTRYGDLNWVSAREPSSGELIYRLLKIARWPITKLIADNLFTAVSTDTGATPELASVTVQYSVLSDQTAPVITGRTPAPGATGLALSTAVTIGFNEGVDPSSVTATSVRLYASGSSADVTATRTVNGSTVTLTPAAPLAAGTVYTVSISTAVTDLVGNPIQTPDSWTFTTTTTFTNTPAPTISGSAQVGMTLTATLPPWTPAATSVTWQWYADDVAIGGATTSSLTLTSAQLGALITVRATGLASGLTQQTRVSLPTTAVTQPQVTAGTVSITGTAVVGGTLTANPGSWAPAGVSLAYQWRRGGSPITGATSATYHPVAADVGQTLGFSKAFFALA